MNLGPNPKELAAAMADELKAKVLPELPELLKQVLIGRTITVTDLIPGRTFTVRID